MADLADEIEFEDKQKFWLPVRRFAQNDHADAFVASGSIQISISIVPKLAGEKYQQGNGRAEPNSDPYLPEPEGRIKLSINPLEMLRQLVPPELQRKLMLGLCAGFCCFLFVLMAPMVISNLIAKGLTGGD